MTPFFAWGRLDNKAGVVGEVAAEPLNPGKLGTPERVEQLGKLGPIESAYGETCPAKIARNVVAAPIQLAANLAHF